MKHHGSTSDYTHERNDNIMRTYLQIIEERTVIVLSEVFRSLVNMPARRFWVSEERAAIVISAMFRGATLHEMRPLRREMFHEIYRRTNALIAQHPDLSVSDAVARVVRQPAPKFYLTPQSARIIFYRIKTKWFRNEMTRLLSINTS